MKRAFLTSVLVLAAASSAFAQFPVGGGAKALHIGIGAGLSVPVGDVGKTLDNGAIIQGVIRYQPPGMPFGLKASINYSKNDVTVEDAGVDQNQSQSVVSGLGNISIGMNFGPLRPHVSAGVGAFEVIMKTSDVEAGVEEDTDSQLKFGVNGAAGVDLRLSAITLYLEARMDNIYTDQGLNESLKDTSSIQYVPVTVGILF